MTYTDHPEYRGLLAAVLATPADDLPRLVLADWLDEHAEHERAEFIRVQCELAGLKHPDTHYHWGRPKSACDGCRAKTLRRRERELWLAPLVLRDLPDVEEVELPPLTIDPVEPAGLLRGSLVRRGFVSEVRCRLADWIGGCAACADPAVRWIAPGEPCLGCGGRIGPRVVTEQPVQVVRLTDREPWTDGTEQDAPDGFDFTWWKESAWDGRGEGNERGNLPDAIVEKIGELYPESRLIWGGPPSNQHVGFATRDAAHAALSAALLSIAKCPTRDGTR